MLRVTWGLMGLIVYMSDNLDGVLYHMSDNWDSVRAYER